MLPRRAALIATATLAAVALGAVAERASARVVQTIGTTGPHPLRFPSQVALGPSGEVYVMDRGDRDLDPVYVTVYSPSGAELRRWRVATNGAGDAHAMLADSAGNVYFGAVSSHLVLKYSAAGRLLARWPTSAPDPTRAGPAGLGLDPAGNVVVHELSDARIDTFTPDGRLLRSVPVPDGAQGLSVGASGAIHIVDRRAVTTLDAAGTAIARIPLPRQLGRFATTLVEGPAGTFYALENSRIVKVGADGSYQGAVGAGTTSAAVASDGSIYVTSFGPWPLGHGAVLRLAPITTVDETAPSVSVDRFSLVRRPRSVRVPGRLTYTLSEDAELRVSLLRRAKTTNRRHRDFRKFLFMGSLRLPVPAGSRTLALDWRRLGSDAHLPPGEFRVAIVARDDSGNESPPARVTFRVRR